MTNPEEQHSGNREPRFNRLNQFSQNLNQQSQWMQDFKKYCEMNHATLETSLIDSIPTPPTDKPFTDELMIPHNDPLSDEMMESSKCLNLVEIIARSRTLFIALLAALAVWLFGGNALAWVMLGIGVILDQWFVTLQLKARKRRFMAHYYYVSELCFRRHDPAISHQTFLNMERLKKWAVARYDITSAETLMMILGEGSYEAEGEMVKTGPMAGRLVSISTGKEWKLRPELEETE